MLVRGGELDPNSLREDAVRYHSIYGVYGISVFAVRGITLEEMAQQVPLIRFGSLTLMKVKDVLGARLRLEATGRNLRHYTVGFDDLDDGIVRLVGCQGRIVPNPYYEA